MRSPAPARLGVVLTVVVGLLATGCSFIPGFEDTYEVHAEFRRGIGLFGNSPVRVLGIDVGEVTKVENEGDIVSVTMAIEGDTELPADAFAVVVPVTTLGERYIQLGPVYDEGPRLESGDLIPVDRTDVPFEIDELLTGLDSYLGAIDPENATELIENLAAIVDGQGEELNDLIGNASDTVGILADKGDELGGIVDALATLTETLGGRTDTIQSLVRSYDTVSGVLADNTEALNRFILNLNDAAVEVRDLLARHDQPLRNDIGELTTVGRTLQRNISRLDQLFAETPRLFSAAQRAYNAENNWLPLNNQDEPGTTEALYKNRIRDRLAGLCRRLIVLLDGTGAGAALGASGCADTNSDLWDQFLSSESDSEPPGLPALPEGGVPIPDLTPPDIQAELARGLELLLDLIDSDKLASFQALSTEILEAIDLLTPSQIRALTQLDEEQIRALRNVPPGELGATIDRIIAGTLDPSALLDTPALPPLPGGGGGVGLPVGGL